MISDDRLARAFRALAHPRRARLFRLMAERPEVGSSFLSLLAAANMNKASLQHHLNEMEKGGLLTRRRKGAYVAHILTPGAMTLATGEFARLVQVSRRPVARAV